jgi:hypothetical protein
MMSITVIGRRRFLQLPLALLLAPLARLGAEASQRKGGYAVDVGILYRAFTFRLTGTMEESVDRMAQRYHVVLSGQGSRIENRLESRGALRDGRWAPETSVSWVQVLGRQSRTEITYDYARERVEYRARAETFFLGRLRVVDDLVRIPQGLHVDDVVSALLNYADGQWPEQGPGLFRTHVVRRQRADNEGADDIATAYRAELVPFELKTSIDADTGKPVGIFDLTRFSSWAREGSPARVVFGPRRRPELITTSMAYGTVLTIRMDA